MLPLFSLTSLSPMTKNVSPVFKPSLFRTTYGITICPFDDILVITIAVISHLNNLTSKIISFIQVKPLVLTDKPGQRQPFRYLTFSM